MASRTFAFLKKNSLFSLPELEVPFRANHGQGTLCPSRVPGLRVGGGQKMPLHMYST